MGQGGRPLPMRVRGSRRAAGPGRERPAGISAWRAAAATHSPCAGLGGPVCTPSHHLYQVCHPHTSLCWQWLAFHTPETRSLPRQCAIVSDASDLIAGISICNYSTIPGWISEKRTYSTVLSHSFLYILFENEIVATVIYNCTILLSHVLNICTSITLLISCIDILLSLFFFLLFLFLISYSVSVKSVECPLCMIMAYIN